MSQKNFIVMIRNLVMGMLLVMLLPCPSSRAERLADYYVSPSGIDTNPGSIDKPFFSIQRAINFAQPGQIIEVLPGTYTEALKTVRSGTSISPIVIRASGIVNVSGMTIAHSYIEFNGFSLDGNHGNVTTYLGVITVNRSVVGCRIINNVIHEWKTKVYGINFDAGSGLAPQHCIVRNNVLRGAGFHMISITGLNHLIERNTFDTSNGWDAMRVFGAHHLIGSNYFVDIDEKSGIGNHTDIIQGFDDSGAESHDITFEGNFIYDSTCQMGQINNDRYSTKVYNWTFRNNVFAKMAINYNLNASMRGVTFLNNTLLNTGTVVVGRISDNSTIASNVMIGNSRGTSTSGWYTSPQGKIYPGMLNQWTAPLVDCAALGLTDNDCINARAAESNKVLQALQAQGLLGIPDGNLIYPILSTIEDITSATQLNLDVKYQSFKEIVFQTLKIAYNAGKTFLARNNYVSGPAPLFERKDARCTSPYMSFVFCEEPSYPTLDSGEVDLNGGNPQLKNIDDPLGPDKKPFTADDGLIPQSISRLCAQGVTINPDKTFSPTHIGAYPCYGTYEGAGADLSAPPRDITPKAPTNLRVQ